METIPQIVFNGIMIYATEKRKLLKQVATWERVCKRFSARLMVEFWQTIQKIAVRFFPVHFQPFPMTIESDAYATIDLRALVGFNQKEIRRTIILFAEETAADFLLPSGFAESISLPFSITVGNFQNLNDPEIINLLQHKCNTIKRLHFFITNPTLNDDFVNVFLTFKSLYHHSLYSNNVTGTKSVEIRKSLVTRIKQLPILCLLLTSNNRMDCKGIFGDELFTLLEESETIKCLHLKRANHYVDLWLANSFLHNRAAITNLCIVNDQFGYYRSEMENKPVPLYHSLASYRLLFPNLQFLCFGISILQLEDPRLDSMLLCYYLNDAFNIQLHLTVRLFHTLPAIPPNRFNWVFTKLEALQAKIVRKNKSETEARISITSKSSTTLPFKRQSLLQNSEKEKCLDFGHCKGYSIHCLCASNHMKFAER